MSDYSFPQADNLEFIYQVLVEYPKEGFSRYSFGEKYNISDRQGAYYLNALCFIELAKKNGKIVVLSKRGETIQALEEPFRKKVFQLAVLENQFICDTYHMCKDKEKGEQKEIIELLIEGTFGINDEATKARRARTLMSWYKWFSKQQVLIEERYNI